MALIYTASHGGLENKPAYLHIMRLSVLLLFALLLVPSAKVLAQGVNCCNNCTCYTCAEVDDCLAAIPPLNDPSNCTTGGSGTCGNDGPFDCGSFAENNVDNGGVCVPIDGGLGFLIAGGLGMGVIGTRRRKETALVTE